MPTNALHSDNHNPVDVEIKSIEIQEILGAPPKGLIKWGITAISFVLLLLFITSHFIRYPETIKARVKLTSYSPPKSMVVRSSGRLMLFVQDNQFVEENAQLGLIQSSANSQDILQLLGYIDQFKSELFGHLDRESIKLPEDISVGELQLAYLSVLNSLKEYDLFKGLDFYEKQLNVLEHQIQLNLELHAQLQSQIELGKEELFLARKKLLMDSTLYTSGVIAELEFDRTKSAYLVVRRNYELVFQSITNNKITRTELKSRIGELQLEREEKISTLKNKISSSLKQLESQLREWEQKYLLKAPVKGVVSFPRYRSNDQFVNAGEEVMKIIPESDRIFGELLMSVAGSGKVERGQRVNIRLDNYPSTEYGLLIGQVESISSLPEEDLYAIHVALPRGLTTTYKKELPLKQEMQGNAEIITKDLRLTERILNQFRSLIDKTTFSGH